MPSPITLFATIAARKALEDDILPAFTEGTGASIEPVFDTTARLLGRIGAGEEFDVMIGITGPLERLSAQRVVDVSTCRPVARVGIGLAVPRGNPRPDISTRESLTRTLLAAESVAYSKGSVSGTHFVTALKDLGIYREVNSRATIVENGFVATHVAEGSADIAIQQMSQLAFVPGVDLVGLLPQGVQHYSELSAALSTSDVTRPDALAFIEYLRGAVAATSFARANLEASS